MYDRIQCSCSYSERSRSHRRLYYRDGEGFGYRRRYSWVPIGYLCLKTGTFQFDDPPISTRKED